MTPRSVAPERFRPATPDERSSLRAGLGIADAFPVIVFVGGVCRRKGADLLMPVFAGVRERYPRAQLLIVGRSDATAEEVALSAAIRDDAARLGAADTVRVDPPVADVERYVRAADLFLFPTRREGFGTVIVEALACGVPSVVHRIPGINDFIATHEEDALLVTEDAAPAYLAAALRLLDDPGLRRRIAEAGLRTVSRRFTDAGVDRRYAELYAGLRAGAPEPAEILVETSGSAG